MSESMIERVAKALELDSYASANAGISTDEMFRRQARAALEEMREPPSGLSFEKVVFHGDYGDDVWRDMIDSVLRGKRL